MAETNEDDPRLLFLPIEKATNPPAGVIEHIKDRWWAVHLTKGLVFYRSNPKWCLDQASPQCNLSKDIACRTTNMLYPWAVVQFFPSVFRRINPRDW